MEKVVIAGGTSGLGAINGAIEIMVPTLAKELKPLRINAIAPGVVNTTWWDFLPFDKKQETFNQYAETIPLGRTSHRSGRRIKFRSIEMPAQIIC